MSLSIGNPSGSAVDKFMNSLRMDAPLNVPPRPPAADMMGGILHSSTDWSFLGTGGLTWWTLLCIFLRYILLEVSCKKCYLDKWHTKTYLSKTNQRATRWKPPEFTTNRKLVKWKRSVAPWTFTSSPFFGIPKCLAENEIWVKLF